MGPSTDKKIDDKNFWKIWFKAVHKSYIPHSHIVQQILGQLNYNIKGFKILEIGAGTGRDSWLLAKYGAQSYALDYATTRMIKKKFYSDNLPLICIQADGENLPFKDKFFNLVFSQGLIEHYQNPSKLIEEQIRVLKNQGYLVIDTPQTYSLYNIYKTALIHLENWPMVWERSYSVRDMKKISSKYALKLVKLTGWDVWPLLIRTLHKTEIRKKKIFPKKLRQLIEMQWRRYENSKPAAYTAMNITAIFQKI
ncbi:MAG: class I SAM-dependent methyltransferase [Candidatus Jordarchaeum sp.]|uniref:class I SAM-dependent methyltransferase n=1 Tax=Candidatus Jordarchaeum sp. TaxID=2823881 RepID=UPI0040496A4F